MSDTVPVHIGNRPEAITQQHSKRPYEGPRLLFREPLEAVAAVCPAPNGKASPNPPFNCIVANS